MAAASGARGAGGDVQAKGFPARVRVAQQQRQFIHEGDQAPAQRGRGGVLRLLRRGLHRASEVRGLAGIAQRGMQQLAPGGGHLRARAARRHLVGGVLGEIDAQLRQGGQALRLRARHRIGIPRRGAEARQLPLRRGITPEDGDERGAGLREVDLPGLVRIPTCGLGCGQGVVLLFELIKQALHRRCAGGVAFQHDHKGPQIGLLGL